MTFHDGTIDGAPPLAIRDHGGAGLAVLLVHGIGRTLEDWSLVAPLLCHGHRVVSVDLRGHGRSGDGGWAWEDVVADLERVVRRLDLGRAAIIGHSLGGVVATMYAARHPDCPAAVNIDGHTWLPPDAFPGLPPDIARERLSHMREWMRQQASAMGAPLSAAGFGAVLHAQQPWWSSSGFQPNCWRHPPSARRCVTHRGTTGSDRQGKRFAPSTRPWTRRTCSRSTRG
ncbi:alpha/beta fold hydrolase [Archangium gephyra]|uniref:alpha/beta fold hydrolase n=1 Tax=Archangium gephyra TaxID=48 RepID=UPI003B7CB234